MKQRRVIQPELDLPGTKMHRSHGIGTTQLDLLCHQPTKRAEVNALKFQGHPSLFQGIQKPGFQAIRQSFLVKPEKHRQHHQQHEPSHNPAPPESPPTMAPKTRHIKVQSVGWSNKWLQIGTPRAGRQKPTDPGPIALRPARYLPGATQRQMQLSPWFHPSIEP